MFAQAVYEQVVEAYLSGLEVLAAKGGDISQIASVASFFVSRIDTAVDKLLDEKIAQANDPDEKARLNALKGKIAVANAKLAYQRYKRLFDGARWQALAAKGAKTQRLLWASTGTKNKAYSDVLYVEELIGPDTVNTIPVATMDAFRDHGKLADTLADNVADAQRVLGDLGRAGISLDAVTDKLVEEGVRLFADAADKLFAAVAEKRGKILDGKIDTQTLALGDALTKKADATAEEWRSHGNVRKLWQRDKSLWTGTDEDRWLGWLDGVGADQIKSYQAFAEEIRREGFTDALLLGMGGSSLGPEVLAAVFGHKQNFPRLRILDSTVPAQIKALERTLDLGKTLFIVSSKSGSTTEPNIFKDYFFKRVADAVGEGESRPAFCRHHRSGLGAGAGGQGAELSQDILRRAQHRRPLLRAVAVRPGAGGHCRHRHRGAGKVGARDDAFLRPRRAAVAKSRRRARPRARRRRAGGARQGDDFCVAAPGRFRRLGRAVDRRVHRQER